MSKEETVSKEEILELLVKAQEDEIKQLKRENIQLRRELECALVARLINKENK